MADNINAKRVRRTMRFLRSVVNVVFCLDHRKRNEKEEEEKELNPEEIFARVSLKSLKKHQNRQGGSVAGTPNGDSVEMIQLEAPQNTTPNSEETVETAVVEVVAPPNAIPTPEETVEIAVVEVVAPPKANPRKRRLATRRSRNFCVASSTPQDIYSISVTYPPSDDEN